MASKNANNGPVARSERLLVETVGDETVIYDQDSSVAHALKPLAASVFMYADGEHTLAGIAELTSYRLRQPVTEGDVEEALAQLAALDLLEPEVGRDGLSRRDALKVLAAAGAGTMLVSSVAAPFAMATTNVADDYLCATYDGFLESSSGQALYPQVWSSVGRIDYSRGVNSYSGSWVLAAPGTAGGPRSGSAASDYDLGQPCYIAPPTPVKPKAYQWFTGQWHTGNYNGKSYGSGACYDQNNGSVLPTSQVGSQTQCETTGFYVDSSGKWFANAPTNTAGGVANNYGGDLCVSNGVKYYNVDEGVCNPGNYICVTSDNVWDGTNGGEQPVACGNGHKLVYLGNPGSDGIYQCLPCDGKAVGKSYQCCDVVCAPAGSGGVVTPSNWSPSTSQATGPGNYTESACQIWGGSFCTQYASKWCTDNPCNLTGDCGS